MTDFKPQRSGFNPVLTGTADDPLSRKNVVSQEDTMDGRQFTLRTLSLGLVLLGGAVLIAQTHAGSAPVGPVAPQMPNHRDEKATQTQLIQLLRLSPKLTTVVSHDPSLLSDQAYVERNNPLLAAFLTEHPEVVRNPDFFLFSHLSHEPGEPDEVLERAVWPDIYRAQNESALDHFVHGDMAPLLVFLGFVVLTIWMVRIFVENRRWGKVFKLQSDVHGRLIDKFSTSQELATYMETDAGKRFLEAAPIAVSLDNRQRVPNAVARVLAPLQIGVVMVLLGAGLLGLRHASPDMDVPMLVLGTVVLMPGIGFILSAGLTWLLASRLGLMPPPAEGTHADPPYGQKQ